MQESSDRVAIRSQNGTLYCRAYARVVEQDVDYLGKKFGFVRPRGAVFRAEGS